MGQVLASFGLVVMAMGLGGAVPVPGPAISDVSGAARARFRLVNMVNVKLERVTAVVPGALLSLTNVTGEDLDEGLIRTPSATRP